MGGPGCDLGSVLPKCTEFAGQVGRCGRVGLKARGAFMS